MRFSPIKILQGLLCTTPILLLTLAACGGGGGGDTPAPSATYYTLGGAVSGFSSGTGLVLRNNGGDDKTILNTDTSYTFATSVAAGSSYNVTVLTQPSSPTQLCMVANASGIMPGSNIDDTTLVNPAVSCGTAWTIGVTGSNITGLTGTGLVLQNNGGDNLVIPANPSGTGTFTFKTPVANNATYNITVYSQPLNLSCSVGNTSSAPVTADDISNITINCISTATSPDQYVYVANYSSKTVSSYTSSSGALTAGAAPSTGNGPYSIAVDPAGKFAYVANNNASTLSAYSITGGVLAAIDTDSSITGTQYSIATGTSPRSIAIHPSGKFAYGANYGTDSVSAYSIDAAGALARIDSDGLTAGNQTSIPARSNPVSIAIDPTGSFAYVANSGDASVSVYSIDATTGALTAMDADGSGISSNTYISAGTTPYSVAVDPTSSYLYVANEGSSTVSAFDIGNNGAGTLSAKGPISDHVSNPVAIAIHPALAYAYVVNTGNNTVSVYSMSSGNLAYLSQASTGTNPISISIDSTGQYAYVANYTDSTVSAYAINQSDGSLTAVGSPIAAGSNPIAVTTAK